jgi:hypothetical protein
MFLSVISQCCFAIYKIGGRYLVCSSKLTDYSPI